MKKFLWFAFLLVLAFFIVDYYAGGPIVDYYAGGPSNCEVLVVSASIRESDNTTRVFWRADGKTGWGDRSTVITAKQYYTWKEAGGGIHKKLRLVVYAGYFTGDYYIIGICGNGTAK